MKCLIGWGVLLSAPVWVPFYLIYMVGYVTHDVFFNPPKDHLRGIR